jgi:hypothetical protein
MPHVPRRAAVFLALVFTTVGISATSLFSLFCTESTVAIGEHVPVLARYTGGSGQTVHLFAGTADGTTRVTIHGMKFTIPLGGVFAAGDGVLVNGSVTISASIPDDSTLVGSKITWYAVVFDHATQEIIAVTRLGGPIIEDAIC